MTISNQMVIDTLSMFAFLAVELTLLFLLISYIVGVLQEYIPPSKIQTILSSKHGKGYIVAGFLGAITPFCSCSTIPFLKGLLRAKAGFGTMMVFLFASPLLNPIIIGLFAVTFGLEVTIFYFTVALGVSIVAGYSLEKLGFEKYIKADAYIEPQSEGCNAGCSAMVKPENKWIKRGLLIGMLLMGVSSLGSQSRGALLAGGAMLMYFWTKSKNKMIGGVVALIFSIALVTFMPESWHKRMDTIETYEEDASAMGRINAWEAALNLAKDRFMGGGYDGINVLKVFQLYAPNPLDYHDAHSIYFEVLGDHGFIGLMLFFLTGLLAWLMSSGVIRKTKGISELSEFNILARMLQVSLLAYAIGGTFLGLAYFDLYYHLIVLVILCRYLVDEHLNAN